MTDSLTLFECHRPRLHAIAYRMLGAVAEAEDVVQEAWLRWYGTDRLAVQNAEAWLVAITTRLSIDRLRAAKAEREHYTGVWLPEPMLMSAPSTPEQDHELADDVSVAFLYMLERLSPDARAAFLMRDVFDADYEDIAQTLGKTPAAVRQLVKRARQQLREGTPREAVPRATLHRLLLAFADAMQRSDFRGLHALLSDDAELIGDGGGKVGSFSSLIGGKRLAQLFYAGKRRFRDALRIEVLQVNGQWALLRFVDEKLESVQSYETDGTRFTRILVQRNPDKLARIAALTERR
ncbi:RNA polymerase subunit sigma-24 [Pandoraea pnomenusa]|jgi:RNA polymerase sigma-70 factor (ECF subfamily)|uniref:RNA polymerase subunit sigma-24 n=1 Tax=Pandoraea pnomenusa TaxID=93220 RepID=A0ABY6WQJ1_9BURK|nr:MULTISPECIES: RNA polymerase sigma-70 factor [Pandoraea]AHB08174.1 RNA polymerase subunit sigma-24 [Pandoraea pnomenusa 3kgm]AHB75623.1 RNA polymerase subunit sigma-24 [Pandoraea pnomenusa]AHN76059.1 RNA polymerase subunit sigma-24 [Pandoraea pnomenusa]QDH61749.1 RNA polymerase sigma-70 factor [Pandoraea pnomenusa]VVE73405.1 RNA polymerase subunit sigma-24 [Pandoraea pnomenusa]